MASLFRNIDTGLCIDQVMVHCHLDVMDISLSTRQSILVGSEVRKGIGINEAAGSERVVLGHFLHDIRISKLVLSEKLRVFQEGAWGKLGITTIGLRRADRDNFLGFLSKVICSFVERSLVFCLLAWGRGVKDAVLFVIWDSICYCVHITLIVV